MTGQERPLGLSAELEHQVHRSLADQVAAAAARVQDARLLKAELQTEHERLRIQLLAVRDWRKPEVPQADGAQAVQNRGPQSGPSRTAELSEGCSSLVLARPASRLFQTPPRAPKQIHEYRHVAKLSYKEVTKEAQAAYPACAVVPTFGYRRVLHHYRTCHAAKLGVKVDDVLWMFQLHPEAAPGLRLSFSSSLATPACVASYITSYILLQLEDALATQMHSTADLQMEASPAGVHRNRGGLTHSVHAIPAQMDKKRSAPPDGLDSLLSSLHLSPSLVEQLGLSEDKVETMTLMAGVNEPVPMRLALRRMYRATISSYCGSLSREDLAQVVCRFLHTQELALAGLVKESVDRLSGMDSCSAAASDAHATDMEPRRRCQKAEAQPSAMGKDDPVIVSGRCNMPWHSMGAAAGCVHRQRAEKEEDEREREYCHGLASELAALSALMRIELSSMVRDLPAMEADARNRQVKPRGMGVDDVEMDAGWSSTGLGAAIGNVLMSETLAVLDNSRQAFHNITDSTLPFQPLFQVENAQALMYKRLAVSDKQRQLLSDVWSVHIHNKRRMDAAFHYSVGDLAHLCSLQFFLSQAKIRLAEWNAGPSSPTDGRSGSADQLDRASRLPFSASPHVAQRSLYPSCGQPIVSSAGSQTNQACSPRQACTCANHQTSSSWTNSGGSQAQPFSSFSPPTANFLQPPLSHTLSALGNSRFLGQHPEEMDIASLALQQLQRISDMERDCYVDHRGFHTPGLLLTEDQVVNLWSTHNLEQGMQPDCIALCQLAANQLRRFNLLRERDGSLLQLWAGHRDHADHHTRMDLPGGSRQHGFQASSAGS